MLALFCSYSGTRALIPLLPKQSPCAARMDEQHIVLRLVVALSGPADQAGEGFAGVAGVQDDALQAHHQLEGRVALLGGDGVAGSP